MVLSQCLSEVLLTASDSEGKLDVLRIVDIWCSGSWTCRWWCLLGVVPSRACFWYRVLGSCSSPLGSRSQSLVSTEVLDHITPRRPRLHLLPLIWGVGHDNGSPLSLLFYLAKTMESIHRNGQTYVVKFWDDVDEETDLPTQWLGGRPLPKICWLSIFRDSMSLNNSCLGTKVREGHLFAWLHGPLWSGPKGSSHAISHMVLYVTQFGELHQASMLLQLQVGFIIEVPILCFFKKKCSPSLYSLSVFCFSHAS